LLLEDKRVLAKLLYDLILFDLFADLIPGVSVLSLAQVDIVNV